MRSEPKCVKCECRRLLVIDEFQQREDYSGTMPLLVFPSVEPFLHAGKFQIIVCTSCGYTEWWAHDLGKLLAELSKLHPRVRIVDGEPSTPYR